MPQLHWDELELIECLETAPEIEEYEVSYSYKVVQERITLLFTVWQFESVVQISLYDTVSELPITEFALFVRGGIFRKKFKNLEILDIQDCIVAPGRFYYLEVGDMFDKKVWPYRISVEVSVKPQIRVAFMKAEFHGNCS